MKLCTIYTEDVNEQATLDLVSKHFQGYTVTHAIGVWEGEQEQSLVFAFVIPNYQTELLYHLAREIKQENKQQAVLVTVQDVESTLV